MKGKKKAIIVIKVKASKCSNGDGGFQHVIVVTEEEQEVVRPQGFLPSFSCSKGLPSSSPDIKSLRKLASLQNHSNGSSDGDYQQEVIVGNKASSGAASLRGMKQVDQPNECSDGLQISITRKHSSVSNGVGDEAISALSELARRQSGVAPPIVLPTNKPFLVGENANCLFQRDEQKGMRVSSGESMDQRNASPPETQRKEAPPNITCFSVEQHQISPRQ